MRDKLVLSLGVLCAVAFMLLAGMVGYHMGEGATTPAPAAEASLLVPAAASSATPTAQATAPEGSTRLRQAPDSGQHRPAGGPLLQSGRKRLLFRHLPVPPERGGDFQIRPRPSRGKPIDHDPCLSPAGRGL